MTRILLALLFFVMLAANLLELNLSLAPGLSVKNAFLYMIMLGIMVDAALKRNRDVELLSVSVPYGLCIFYAAFTWLVVVLIVDYPRFKAFESFVSLKSNLVDHLIVFLVFFYGVLNTRDADRLLKTMLWLVIAANFISVIDALNLPDLGLISERRDGRVSGPMGESNQYAAYLAMFMPPILGLAMVETGLRRKLALAGFAISILAFLMTVSRGGIVGVLGGSVVAAFLLRNFISARTATLALLGLVGVAAVAVAGLHFAGFGDLMYERLIGLTTGGNTYSASSGRSFIWQTAFKKMFESPLSLVVGYGWDTYRYFPEFNLAPHNTYLKVFFELGLIGLLLVLSAFVNILRIARRAVWLGEPEAATMLFAFIFGFLCMMAAIFFVDLTTPWLFVWAYTGVAMRLAILEIRSHAPESSHRLSEFRDQRYAKA